MTQYSLKNLYQAARSTCAYIKYLGQQLHQTSHPHSLIMEYQQPQSHSPIKEYQESSPKNLTK